MSGGPEAKEEQRTAGGPESMDSQPEEIQSERAEGDSQEAQKAQNNGFSPSEKDHTVKEKTSEPQLDEVKSSGDAGADGGLSRNRQMRPPDFRSILQSDSEPAAAQGGLVLKPLDSLNGGTRGMTSGSNMVSGLQTQNDSASVPALNPLNVHADEQSSFGGFGGISADGGLSRNRQMRPPDFRSILQSDSEPAAAQGGLVLKPLDSLNGGTRGMTSGSNMVSGLQTQNDSASVPALNPLNVHADEQSSFGGFGGISADGGLSRNRQMRPPDFRSILQSDSEPAAAQGGLVLKPLDSLNGGTSGMTSGSNMVSGLQTQNDSASVPALNPLNVHADEQSSFGGFGGISADGGLNRNRQMRPPDFRSILQSDSEPAAAQGGLVLKPLDSLNGGTSGIGNGLSSDAGPGFAQQPDLLSREHISSQHEAGLTADTHPASLRLQFLVLLFEVKRSMRFIGNGRDNKSQPSSSTLS